MARPGLTNHPKFKTLCRLLGEPRPHVLGYLELLWLSAYEAGNPVIGDATVVEAVAEFPGQMRKLTEALLNCGGSGRAGFIEPVPGRDEWFQIHDLFVNAPEYVAGRAQREAERQKVKICAACGAEYHSTDSRSKYCTPNCRKNAWRNQGAADGDGPEQTSPSRAMDNDRRRHRATDGDGSPAPAPTPAPSTKKVALPPLTPSRANGTANLGEFDRFWDTYPRKIAKEAARKAWVRLKPDAALVGTILAAVARHRASNDWQREGGRFVPHPATWLNGRRWEDEAYDTERSGGSSVGPDTRIRAEPGKYAGVTRRIGVEAAEAPRGAAGQAGVPAEGAVGGADRPAPSGDDPGDGNRPVAVAAGDDRVGRDG